MINTISFIFSALIVSITVWAYSTLNTPKLDDIGKPSKSHHSLVIHSDKEIDQDGLSAFLAESGSTYTAIVKYEPIMPRNASLTTYLGYQTCWLAVGLLSFSGINKVLNKHKGSHKSSDT